MDPITHLTTGALGGQAARRWYDYRAVVFFCVIAAIIPDIDNFIGRHNPELYLIHHRGITHSFAGGLAIAMAMAALFRLVRPAVPFFTGLILAYAGIVSHIFQDLITSYGTQILSPFSNNRFTVECVFIIDPIYTLSLLALLIMTFVVQRRIRFVVAAAGLLWVLAYPLMTFTLKEAIARDIGQRLSAKGISYARVHLTPEFLTPFYWRVIVEDRHEYRMAAYSLLDHGRDLSYTIFRRADRDLMRRLGRSDSFFSTYDWFSVYPVMQNHEQEGGRRITFGDLRFYSTHNYVRDFLANGDQPFSLTAVLDHGDNLMRVEYVRPRGTKYIQHLE